MGVGPLVIYDVQGDIRIPNDMPVLLYNHVKGLLDKGKIGIRRVLGASSTSLIGLLSRESMILVGLASLLSWPVGYFIVSGWLQKYAYRIKTIQDESQGTHMGKDIFLTSVVVKIYFLSSTSDDIRV